MIMLSFKELLHEILSNVEHRVLLWENQNPNASMGNMTKSMDLSSYKFIDVVFVTYVNQGYINQTLRLDIPSSGTRYGIMTSFSGSGGFMAGYYVALARSVSVNTSGVTFGNGVYAVPNTGVGFTLDSAAVIPFRIYGIKRCDIWNLSSEDPYDDE